MGASAQVLALVGVRSGSRGLPGKNALPLAGHPLMAWIISAALRARTVDRLVVSTDSEEFAGIARAYGAETPFLRPRELAADDSTDLDYVRHALEWLEEQQGYVPDVVVRLLATVPTQLPEDIDAAVELLLADPDATAAVVVARARQHPAKAMRLVTEDGRQRVLPYLVDGSGAEPTARQSHPPAYVRANVVAARTSVIRATGTLVGDVVLGHVIDDERIVDIDSGLDLRLAELVVAALGPTLPAPRRVQGGSAVSA